VTFNTLITHSSAFAGSGETPKTSYYCSWFYATAQALLPASWQTE